MAELAKKLYGKNSNGTTYTCKLYSTTGEVGDNRLAISSSLAGVQGYAKLGATNDSNATGIRAIKNGTTYAVLTQASVAYQIIKYMNAGTYTFTVPSGVSRLKVTVAGGGGGGGTGNATYNQNWGYRISSGYNGGRGGCSSTFIEVASGTVYTVIVGIGGAGGIYKDRMDYNNGSNGGNSYIKLGDTIAEAVGGGGGHGYKGTSNGTSFGNGGIGGLGGRKTLEDSNAGKKGADGWVYVEYGGDI